MRPRRLRRCGLQRTRITTAARSAGESFATARSNVADNSACSSPADCSESNSPLRHRRRLPFVTLANSAKPQRIGGAIPRRPMQPSRQHRSAAHHGSFPPKQQKHRLRDIVSEMRISHLSQRRRVNHVRMATNKLGKCVIRSGEMLAKQLAVRQWKRCNGHFSPLCNADGELDSCGQTYAGLYK